MRLPVEDISVVLKRFPELAFDHSSVQHISTQDVCQVAFWYVNVVTTEFAIEIVFSQDMMHSYTIHWSPEWWFGPQATRRYHFASGIPQKNPPLSTGIPNHSHPIDTRARWGRTSAEYNSLFCIPFSKLLIYTWLDINNISKVLSYFDLASWSSLPKMMYIYYTPKTNMVHLKIPPWKKEKHLQNQQLLGSMFVFEGANIILNYFLFICIQIP